MVGPRRSRLVTEVRYFGANLALMIALVAVATAIELIVGDYTAGSPRGLDHLVELLVISLAFDAIPVVTGTLVWLAVLRLLLPNVSSPRRLTVIGNSTLGLVALAILFSARSFSFGVLVFLGAVAFGLGMRLPPRTAETPA